METAEAILPASGSLDLARMLAGISPRRAGNAKKRAVVFPWLAPDFAKCARL